MGTEITATIDCLHSGMLLSVIVDNYPAGTLSKVTRIDLDNPGQGEIGVRGLVDIPPSAIKNVVDYELPVGCRHQYVFGAWSAAGALHRRGGHQPTGDATRRLWAGADSP